MAYKIYKFRKIAIFCFHISCDNFIHSHYIGLWDPLIPLFESFDTGLKTYISTSASRFEKVYSLYLSDIAIELNYDIMLLLFSLTSLYSLSVQHNHVHCSFVKGIF